MTLYLTSLKPDGLLSLIKKEPSAYKVLFIPTAANTYDDPWFMEADQKWCIDQGFQLTSFDIVDKNQSTVDQALSQSNIIYCAGGNTFYLLNHIKQSGLSNILRKHLRKGLIYAGSSAGAVVAGMDISIATEFDDPKTAPKLTDYTGLQLINLCLLPHYGQEKYQEKYKVALKQAQDNHHPVLTLTDTQDLIVNDNHYQIIEI